MVNFIREMRVVKLLKLGLCVAGEVINAFILSQGHCW